MSIILTGDEPAKPVRDSGEVLHIRTPAQGAVWEYHPVAKRLYLIRLGQTVSPPIAEPMPHEVQTAEIAVALVAMWVRGWKEAKGDLSGKVHYG